MVWVVVSEVLVEVLEVTLAVAVLVTIVIFAAGAALFAVDDDDHDFDFDRLVLVDGGPSSWSNFPFPFHVLHGGLSGLDDSVVSVYHPSSCVCLSVCMRLGCCRILLGGY